SFVSYVDDTGYGDWGDEWGDGWNNGWQYYVGWQDEDANTWETDAGGHGDDAEDPRLQEMHKAEKDAEIMAMEAKRTWSQAQQATAAMRRERKNPGKHAHFMDPDWHWDLAFQKGKDKLKGANWANVYDAAYAFPFGKGKGKFKNPKSGQVNAYVADYYGLEMEAG
ncbi:unnamed protein product, partial [Effrenium voratum]